MSGQEPPPARSPAKSPLSFVGRNSRGNRVETGSTLAAAHLLTGQRSGSRFLTAEIGLNPSICLRVSSSSTSIARQVTQQLHTPACVCGQAHETLFIFYYQSHHRLHFEAPMSNRVASAFDERRSSRVSDGANELGATALLTRPPRPREGMR
jgi:hypothetical protein